MERQGCAEGDQAQEEEIAELQAHAPAAYRLVSQARHRISVAMVRSHTTITRSGEITVEFEIIDTQCQG